MLCSRRSSRRANRAAPRNRPASLTTPDSCARGDFHFEAGYSAGRDLLSLTQPPSAVFAGNDLQALGLYEAARELGLRIPDDLSVVGFDDLPMARWVGPPLTTIRQPLVAMAETAARLALSLGRGERPDTTRVDLATSLVIRHSTAPFGG
ncbi:LacI family DNA-binding transcriptional regulator [Kutzneria sp. 744]|uniref:LacI family DNA-binding transcriptional regulator n=1 Tax=Kutzneria sp. (strain 744) TaxID=345341 RepID=UPI0003EEBA21|nr:substrate-binding domain-containing protein [Kutzneria sp. 744]EWM19351.1 LacI-family transcriptional regulator [Kutzneria sp. 744]